jgi:hypothetical protein
MPLCKYVGANMYVVGEELKVVLNFGAISWTVLLKRTVDVLNECASAIVEIPEKFLLDSAVGHSANGE